MIIHNGFVLLLLRKLCVWQILQKGDPQFLPPPRYVTDVRDVMSLPENSSVAFELPSLLPPLLSMLYILANVHWVSLLKVIELCIHCLCYKRSYHTLTKPTLSLPPMSRIVGVSHKTFFRNTGELYADKQ